LFNVPYSPEKGTTPADFTTERCIELIRKAVGLPQLDVEIISVLPWEAAARYADSIQSGRVFLIGDAAHVMPPAGGFGLNTGVQDAHNLAWKLALVINGVADAALLETYNAERLPVARLVVEQAVGELEAPTPDTPGGRPAGDAAPNNEDDVLMDQLKVILGYRYASQAVIVSDDDLPSSNGLDLTGRPGTRAPHIWLEHQGRRISTLDLFGSRFVLLAGAEGEIWCDTARTLAVRLGLDLATYRIGGDLIDLDGHWSASYGVTPEGAVLVRPDGFVAWRTASRKEGPEETLEKVLSHILCRTSHASLQP